MVASGAGEVANFVRAAKYNTLTTRVRVPTLARYQGRQRQLLTSCLHCCGLLALQQWVAQWHRRQACVTTFGIEIPTPDISESSSDTFDASYAAMRP